MLQLVLDRLNIMQHEFEMRLKKNRNEEEPLSPVLRSPSFPPTETNWRLTSHACRGAVGVCGIVVNARAV